MRAYPAFGAAVSTRNLTQAVTAGDGVVPVNSNTGYVAGQLLRLSDGIRSEVRRIGALNVVTLGVPAAVGLDAGSPLEHVQRADDGAISIKTLDEPVGAGSVVLPVSDRQGLVIGQVLRVGADSDPSVEYVIIRDLPNRVPTAPDAGRIVLDTPLVNAHGGATPPSLQIVAVQQITTPGPVAGQTATLVHPIAAGDTRYLSSAPILTGAPGLNDLARVVRPGRAPVYSRVQTHAASTPVQLGVATPLTLPHVPPQPIFVRQRLLDVVALDPGVWGNRLRVWPPGGSRRRSCARASAGRTGIQDPTHIRLDSAAGWSPGPF